MAATVYRYECTNGGHSKFWEIEFDGGDWRSFVTRWGRIGTDGMSNTKTFMTARQCTDARLKLQRSKTAKGYVLVSTDSVASANVVAKSKPAPLVVPGWRSVDKARASLTPKEEAKTPEQEPATYQRPKRRVRLK